MNTRIQVEHPITEEVVDYDLIKEQIKVAEDQAQRVLEFCQESKRQQMKHQGRPLSKVFEESQIHSVIVIVQVIYTIRYSHHSPNSNTKNYSESTRFERFSAKERV